jgi:putative peptidoglycan lipid II flippase
MNLLRAAGTVSAFTLISRITGLLREQMVAALFGANAMTDAFQVAFRIPNMLRRLFAEGAFSQAFVPALAAERAAHGDESTHALVDATATVLTWALVLVCVVGVVAAPLLVFAMGSGLKPEAHEAAVTMTRWMFPYIACMSLVALAAGILNTWKRFIVSAVTPVLLNLSVIAVGYALHEQLGVKSMALGVMVGGVLQLLVQIPALARLGMLPRIGLGWSRLKAAWAHEGVRRILRAMGPALLGVGVAQLSLVINTQIATHIEEGAASWVSYADRLMEFPIALAGVALGVVLTPLLSAAKIQGEGSDFSDLLDWGLRLVMLFALPCMVALLVFAQPLVAVLYHQGAFREEDVVRTAQAVQGYGLGVLGLVAIKVLAPGFFARQDTRTPVKIAVFVLCVTQLLNVVLVPWLGTAGLAASIGLGALVNAALLFIGLRRCGAYRASAGWLWFALRVVLAAAAMGGLLWAAGHHLDWIHMPKLQRAGVMALTLAAAAGLYLCLLMLFRVDLRALMRQRARN